MSTRRGILVAVCLGLATFLFPVTQAGTITVKNTNDSGPGSLRQAIEEATPNTEILFDPSLDNEAIILDGELGLRCDERQ